MGHSVAHFEIRAANASKMKAFYEGLFGGKIFKAPMGGIEYWLIQSVSTDKKGMPIKPGVNGGLCQKQPGQEEAQKVSYITMESTDESIAKVKKLGGKILVPKQQVPKVGWIAVAADPERNQFGMLQPEM